MIKLAFLITAITASVFLTLALYQMYAGLRSAIADVDLDVRDNDLVNLPVVGRLVLLVSVYNSHSSLQPFLNNLGGKLNLAGRPGGRVSPAEFLAAVELMAVSLLLVFFMFMMIATGKPTNSLVIALVVAAVGSIVPFMWLENKMADRRNAMSRAFPYFMDLSVMSMDAGASFLESLSTYIAENENTPLADEFAQTVSEINMGKSLGDAMISLRERIPTVMVQNALMAIVQGERMGTPMVKVMNEQAEAIRFVRSQNAERLAEEIKIRMQGPAMLLLFSVLLLILGPAAIDMANSDFF